MVEISSARPVPPLCRFFYETVTAISFGGGFKLPSHPCCMATDSFTNVSLALDVLTRPVSTLKWHLSMFAVEWGRLA